MFGSICICLSLGYKRHVLFNTLLYLIMRIKIYRVISKVCNEYDIRAIKDVNYTGHHICNHILIMYLSILYKLMQDQTDLFLEGISFSIYECQK